MTTLGQQVVTELVIDSSGATAGANQFESAMGSAERAARKTVGGMADLSGGIGQTISALGGLAALFTGGVVIAGLTGFIDQIVKANKSLADMQTMAKQTGLTLADFQGLQFGGAVAGLTPDQINEGLQKSAKLLNDASRNSNTLSKELAENGISIKNANGQLISQNQLLGIAADLIKRAKNPGDANAIAEMLGFTKEWIPLLEQGKGVMAGLTDEARKAGAVLDDDTIKRATEFDKQWRKSSVEFSSYMKSALLSLLPFLDDLIERAAQFVKSIDREKIEKHANDNIKALTTPLGIPNEAGIKIDEGAFARVWKEMDDGSKTVSERIIAAAQALRSSVQMIPAQDVKWHGGTSSVMDTSDATIGAAKNAAAWTAEGKAWKQLSDDIVSGADKMVGGFSKVVGKDEANDLVDRAINTLRRHVEQQKADTEAVGLGAAALALFRARAAETAAVLANSGEETKKQAADFKALQTQAENVAAALAKAKVASQNEFNQKTAFLSPQDVAIAQQLREIYGNNIPAALASSEAAAMRFNNTLKSVNDLARNSATSFTTDLISGLGQGQTAVESLHNAFKNLSSTLTSSALKSLFEGDFISAGIKGIAAIGAAIFSANTSSSGDKWLKQQTEGMNTRGADIAQQRAMIGVDTNTRAGAVLAQDAEFEAKRRAENVAGGQKMNDLLQLQIQQRNQLLKEWDQKETDIVKANADAKLAIEKAAADRALSLQDRLFAATNDFTTLEGQLAAQARTAEQQRLAEQLAGNQNSVLLEQTLAAEKFKIIRDSNAKIIADTQAAAKAQQDAINGTAKNIVDFVANLRAGPNTTLSPLDRRAAAQSIYNTDLALSQANDPGAQARITQDAQNYLDAERAISASSVAFQTVLSTVSSQLLALPAVQNTTDPVVQSLRDVLDAINVGNKTQATDLTLGTLLTKAQLKDLGVATNERVDLLLTAAQLTEQGLAKDAVVKGILTKAQVDELGLSTDSTTHKLLTKAQMDLLGLATDTKVGTLLTPQQLADAHLASDTTVGTLLTQAQLAQQGLAKDINVAKVANNSGYLPSISDSSGQAGANSGFLVNVSNKTASMNTFSDRIIQAINAQGTMQAGNLAQLVLNSAVLLNWQPLVVDPVHGVSGSNSGAPAPYTAHAMGGVIPAYGLGLVSEHSPGGGRFVRAGNEPITVSPFPATPVFRGTNDNGGTAALIVEVRELRKELAMLQKMVAASGNQVSQTIVKKADEQMEVVDESGKRIAYATTQAAKEIAAAA